MTATGGRPKAIARVPESKRAKVLELARAGRPLELIADVLGISRDTLHAARTRARDALARQEAGEALNDDEASELEFISRLLEARAQRAFELQDGVEAGGGEVDWRALAWSLERMQPDVFGSRSKTEVTGPEGGPVQVEGRAPLLFIPAKRPDE
jgi:hypothetical protein